MVTEPSVTVTLGPVTSTDREILRLAVPAFLALVAEPLFLLSDAAIVGHLGTTELAGLGHRRRRAPDPGRPLRLPRLRHHRERRAPPRRRRPPRRADPGHRRLLARGADRRRRHGRRCRLRPASRRPLRRRRRGERPGDGVPRGRDLRDDAAAAHAGHHRGAPRPAGHPHPAVGRGRRQPRQHRAQRGLRLRPRPRHRRLRARLGAGPGRQRRPCWSPSSSGPPAATGAPLTPDRRGITGRPRAPACRSCCAPSPCAPACSSAPTPSPSPAGDTEIDLATHQIAITLWTFLAFALDALAIAAQAITGRALGAGDVEGTRRLTRRMVQWGWGAGIASGLLLAASRAVPRPALLPRLRGAPTARTGAARRRARASRSPAWSSCSTAS